MVKRTYTLTVEEEDELEPEPINEHPKLVNNTMKLLSKCLLVLCAVDSVLIIMYYNVRYIELNPLAWLAVTLSNAPMLILTKLGIVLGLITLPYILGKFSRTNFGAGQLRKILYVPYLLLILCYILTIETNLANKVW